MIRMLATALCLACVAGCANPYCGALGEPCCGSAADACAPTLSCHAGVCGQCSHEGDDCCADQTCDGAFVCSRGLVHDLCLLPCDAYTNDCPPDRNCIWTPDDPGICVPIGTRSLDAACENADDCVRGLMCVTHPTTRNFYCEPPCMDVSTCPAAPMGQTRLCLPIVSGDARMTCF